MIDCFGLVVRVWKSDLSGCTPYDRDRNEVWVEEFCARAEPMGMSMEQVLNKNSDLRIITRVEIPKNAIVSLIGGVAGTQEGEVSGKISQSINYTMGWVSTIERMPLPFKIGTAADCQVKPNKLRSECYPC